MLPIGTTSYTTSERARSRISQMRHNALQSTSLLLAFAAACQQPAPRMQAPEVTVAPAITRDVADWDEFTGHLEATEAVDVRPRVSGFIQSVAFHEGAIVGRGDVLLTIDQRPY